MKVNICKKLIKLCETNQSVQNLEIIGIRTSNLHQPAWATNTRMVAVGHLTIDSVGKASRVSRLDIQGVHKVFRQFKKFIDSTTDVGNV